jgi:DNA adenine methylase
MPSTFVRRQAAQVLRDGSRGINPTYVGTHETSIESLRWVEHTLERPDANSKLADALSELQATASNVSKVRHISPFRYPGGKTWLVPTVHAWLRAQKKPPELLIEPFAGGASVGLSVANLGLATRVLLAELDAGVAAVWDVLLNGKQSEFMTLRSAVDSFEMTERNALEILGREPGSRVERAFATIVANRSKRGGILAPGAGLMKAGEGGRGIASRWYPKTLVRRFDLIRAMRARLIFEHRDAFELLDNYRDQENICWFVDPPYTVGGKKPGSRLYSHHVLDHARLFCEMGRVRGALMATYDVSPEVFALANGWGFAVHDAYMRNTHNEVMNEVVLLRPAATLR